jgi:hypothetical protein
MLLALARVEKPRALGVDLARLELLSSVNSLVALLAAAAQDAVFAFIFVDASAGDALAVTPPRLHVASVPAVPLRSLAARGQQDQEGEAH